ncbi:TetR/AcrR family transcriptional regulator [Brevibacterium daeguense]|uniref:TetR/AcrR family transcriptional regulator n=1 Tax=Brevibacterium daeguense TaxID=909936 RepID=A0ABP8EET6_9MICO|nr:TetR/AcrR family transcriptional regulator [Brevibacterium daeguense]
MTRPRRTHAQAREQMRRGILTAGSKQLAERGAAALSVREIARELGVASSAIYRHVANRDELLTMLLVDAFTELAEAVLQAADDAVLEDAAADHAVPADAAVDDGAAADDDGAAADDAAAVDARAGACGVGGPGAELAAIARTTRTWACANPAKWGLIYGTPVPGYSAPAEQTTAPGVRVMGRFAAVLSAGRLAEAPPVSPEFRAELVSGGAEVGVHADPELMAEALAAWTALVGMISAEVFGHLGPELAEHGEEMLERWIAEVQRRFRLD